MSSPNYKFLRLSRKSDARDGRTDGQTATLNATPRGRIIMGTDPIGSSYPALFDSCET